MIPTIFILFSIACAWVLFGAAIVALIDKVTGEDYGSFPPLFFVWPIVIILFLSEQIYKITKGD